MAEDGKNKKSLAIRQSTEPVEVKYSPTFQGKAINAFSSISTTAVKEKAMKQWQIEQSKKPKAEQQSLFPGEGYNTPVQLVRGEVLYTVPPWAVITGRTIQVIRYITSKFTKASFQSRFLPPEERKACRIIEIAIKEVADVFGMKDPKAVKAMLNTELNVLWEVTAEWMEFLYVKDEKTGKKTKPQEVTHFRERFIDKMADTVPVIEDTDSEEKKDKKREFFKRGKTTVRLTEGMAEYLQNSYIFHIADNFYKIQPKKNPYSVAFYDEIITCYRSNMNNTKNRDKDTEKDAEKENKEKVIIKVSTLLAKTDIKKYDDIAEKGEINRRIFSKLERDMDNLQELGLINDWDYCKTNGVKLSQDERKKMTYKQFESYNVEVIMPDSYPRYNSLPSPEDTTEGESQQKESLLS